MGSYQYTDDSCALFRVLHIRGKQGTECMKASWRRLCKDKKLIQSYKKR